MLRARLRARAAEAEARAILTGQAVATYTKRREAVPAWAWLNSFAHRDLGWLCRQRSWSFGEGLPTGANDPLLVWRWAEARIAEAILSAVGFRGALLAELQREVLVPLEIELLERSDRQPAPEELVLLVRTSLEAHVATRRHAY